MIGFICGEIVGIEDNVVTLKNSGIGYELTVSNNTIVSCSEIGREIQLFTYLQVKEDGICLFGFSTFEEKKMFIKLITVSGVGPKLAINILSGIKINDLALAILNSDSVTLCRVKGLGKKTAERLILELKEKISPFDTFNNFQNNANEGTPTVADDVLLVLLSLGLTRAEAVRKVKLAIDNGCKTTEEILNASLKN